MTRIPLIIISTDQDIPIPNNTFVFSLSKDEYNTFATTELDISSDTYQNTFILGISEEDSLSLSLALATENKIPSLAKIGNLCLLRDIDEGPFNTKITCHIICRTKLLVGEFTIEDDIIRTPLNAIKEKLLPGEDTLLKDLRMLVDYLMKDSTPISEDIKKRVKRSSNLIKTLNILANSLELTTEEKFFYLQCEENLDRFTLILRNLVEIIGEPITKKASESMEDMDLYPLAPTSSKKEFLTTLPEKIAEKIQKETDRLSKLSPTSMEYQAASEYLDWIMGLPWGINSYIEADLNDLRKILDKSHFGLDPVKSHIIEYLNIEQISKTSKGLVLCFVGSPGTGKTSIVKSIAEATNRKLIRIALGGMADEAEIRGHRRTYVASRPGRIVTGIKNAGTMDPLFLFDEVDKTDIRKGDPLAALLEVLDPEQNDEFIDRYLEVGIDLSKAMFVCTANYIDMVPKPLLDRLEIIHFPDYKSDEKFEITKHFILPKSLEEYNIKDMDIDISEDLQKELSKTYSVREIERKLKKLLRRAALNIRVYGETSYSFTKEEAEKIFLEMSPQKNKPIGF